VPDESHLTPAAVLASSHAALRGCGLSERKASYLQELAAHFVDGRLTDELLAGAVLLVQQ
jgi:DNA-3-methyladenine glycosylase II